MSKPSSPPQKASPYGMLYIYYLQGRIPEEAQIEHPSFIGNWEEDGFSFLFFTAPAEQAVRKLLRGAPHLALLDQYQMSYEDWQGGRVAPFRAGRFRIRPPWDNGGPGEGEIDLLLDPGVVFGTGTHPTTRDCLAALETLLGREPIRTVLDLGTGTGLLALAAARLGARRILAVDLNRLAVRTAAQNIRLNRLDQRVLAVQGNAGDLIHAPADLLIANIHYDVMKRLIASPAFAVKPWFILSGLLRSEAREVTSALSRPPFELIRQWDRDATWYTLLGRRTPAAR